MKAVLACLLGFALAGGAAPLAQGQTSDPNQSTAKTETVPELSYQLVRFLPSYRFVGTSGFPGRVGEYDSLFQSVGGDVAMTFLNYEQNSSLKYHGNFINRERPLLNYQKAA